MSFLCFVYLFIYVHKYFLKKYIFLFKLIIFHLVAKAKCISFFYFINKLYILYIYKEEKKGKTNKQTKC